MSAWKVVFLRVQFVLPAAFPSCLFWGLWNPTSASTVDHEHVTAGLDVTSILWVPRFASARTLMVSTTQNFATRSLSSFITKGSDRPVRTFWITALKFHQTVTEQAKREHLKCLSSSTLCCLCAMEIAERGISKPSMSIASNRKQPCASTEAQLEITMRLSQSECAVS